MDIERRIERLERENRKLRRVLTVIVIAGCGGLLMAQATPEKAPETIRAQNIEVVDSDGKTRVWLGENDGGHGAIWTFNSGGHPIIKLTATTGAQAGGAIVTLNGSGKENDQELAVIGASVAGSGTFRTMNGNGQSLVELGVSEKVGTITVYEGGKAVSKIGALESGDGGAIEIFNKTGQAVCTLEVDEYGNGRIGAWDRNGKGRTLKPGP